MTGQDFKRIALRIFFTLEILVFTIVYFVGPQGIQTLWRLQGENDELANQINGLHTEIDSLQGKIVAWNTHDFYKEKVAREQLQMARKGEQIYYIG